MDLQLQSLIELIEELLGPKGCPWGKAQSPKSLCHYVIEECYEVIDAMEQNNAQEMEEELGDVLFAFLFTLSAAVKKYDLKASNVVDLVTSKIKRRHPHVFEDPRPITFEELRIQWEEIKAKERDLKGGEKKDNPIASIAQSMPVVLKAMKLIELGVSKKFDYEPDEATLSGKFMKLIIEGLDQHENLERHFNEGAQDYQRKFEKYLEKEKTGDNLTT